MSTSQEPVPDVRRFRATAFAVGLVAGIFSALLGVGGGLIMVPAMALLLRIRQQRAVATSLAVIIPTALAAAFRYNQSEPLDLGVIGWLALGGVFGGVIGAIVANLIGARQLRRIFGVFVILVGILMITRYGEAQGGAQRVAVDAAHGMQLLGWGVFVGVMSGLLGVGGGLVMVPVLVLLLGYTQHLAQGTSLAVIIPVSLSGTFIHIRKGNVVWDFAAWLAVGAVIGSWVTSGFVHSIPGGVLRILFAVFMIWVGSSMLFGRQAQAPAPAPREGTEGDGRGGSG